MSKYKHILDSVHGNIYIDQFLVKNVIDTPEFQRLRRIEQTSTRALFPSARHDRFIHSLGVYYIGTLMADQLIKVVRESDGLENCSQLVEELAECFKIACLLHDIGHSPFSHTFEKYFGDDPKNDEADGKQVLIDGLLKEVQKVNTSKTRLWTTQELISKRKNTNFHEYTSAIIATRSFAQFYPHSEHSDYDNTEFVARMIIGCKYYYKRGNVDLQLRNCFIDLLHGGIIDADRLDYACRDVWASGYKTSSIYVQRLIAGLFVDKSEDNHNEYVVCFKSNVLNEIQSVLDVKDFQVQYVLNHHIVQLEQYFLEHAALQMAQDIIPTTGTTITPLRQILRYQILTHDGVIIPSIIYNGKPLTIKYMSDDDLMFLMKLSNNSYYQKWAKRQYGYTALWKTRDEFFYHFELPRTSIREKLIKLIKETILNTFPSIKNSDILVKEVEYKPRIGMDDLHIFMSKGHVTQYKKLYRETDIIPVKSQQAENSKFIYVFVKNEALQNNSVQQIIDVLKGPISKEYKRNMKRLREKETYKKMMYEEFETFFA